MIYEVKAYTGRWAYRRKFFVRLSDAREWATEQFEEDDVCQIWMTTLSTKTGEIIENKPILTK